MSHNTNGNHREYADRGSANNKQQGLSNKIGQWATPRSGNPGSRKPGTGGKVLAQQAKQWGTPRTSMAGDKQEDSGRHRLGEQAQNGSGKKLNPR